MARSTACPTAEADSLLRRRSPPDSHTDPPHRKCRFRTRRKGRNHPCNSGSPRPCLARKDRCRIPCKGSESRNPKTGSSRTLLRNCIARLRLPERNPKGSCRSLRRSRRYRFRNLRRPAIRSRRCKQAPNRTGFELPAGSSRKSSSPGQTPQGCQPNKEMTPEILQTAPPRTAKQDLPEHTARARNEEPR